MEAGAVGSGVRDTYFPSHDITINLSVCQTLKFCVLFFLQKKKKIKRKQATFWRKIFTKDTSDKRLFSKIYKEYLEINNRKKKIPIKKWAKPLPDTLSEKTCRWQINVSKVFHIVCFQRNAN